MKHSVVEMLRNMDSWITEKDCVAITELLVDIAERPPTLKKMLDIISDAYTYESSKVS